MTTRDFSFWLKGFFEVSNAEVLTMAQVDIIKNRLNLVFKYDIGSCIDNEVSEAEIENIRKAHAQEVDKIQSDFKEEINSLISQPISYDKR